MALNRQQAITWTKAYEGHQCIYAAIGGGGGGVGVGGGGGVGGG